jgi:hypothetical protein
MKTNRVVADMVVNITTPVHGSLEDWPPMLQDRVHKEIEARSKISGKNWQHLRSRAGIEDGTPYIHVTLFADVPIQ